MKFIADFHIHSHYSIATSKSLVPEKIAEWAVKKGIRVVGTGDFTHPGWYEELKDKLEPAEPGLFRLKECCSIEDGAHNIGSTRFILTSEISSIYKKGEKVRKVHNLIFAPDFSTVLKIQHELSKIGNITSDGRPILGLDSKDLLEIALSCSESCFFVPAHIWTPWFSVLGSGSGFSNISECYGDLSHYIRAVETGLSSDPAMNMLCSFLDRYTLISNSDAHSPQRLGREANLFDTELSYDAMTHAMKSGDPSRFLGTVEFFPQEGKYHYDGHRKCGVRLSPERTLKSGGICPVCGKKVTVGVMNRVFQLADRKDETERTMGAPFYSLIPLPEILSEIVGTGPSSKRVRRLYEETVQTAGSEFDLLINLPLSDIEPLFPDLLTEAIRRMRAREVYIEEGFDGEYGRVRVFEDGEVKRLGGQKSLFTTTRGRTSPGGTKKSVCFSSSEYKKLINKETGKVSPEPVPFTLNEEQKKAAGHEGGPAIVLAGPGTGKTQVLTMRIALLILERGVPPESILALTFTNKAAYEMLKRVQKTAGLGSSAGPFISTFHRFGLSILRDHPDRLGRKEGFSVAGAEDRRYILESLGCERRKATGISEEISLSKQCGTPPAEKEAVRMERLYESYLKEQNLFDLDDLVTSAVDLLSRDSDLLASYRDRYGRVLVDEYQDINHSQYSMVRLLAPSCESDLFVIGDPDQAIYGFRGASAQFSDRFAEDYPSATVYRLRKSYRCSAPILKGSCEVMRKGGTAEDPLFLEGKLSDVKIRITDHPTDKSEAEWVARTIEQMMGGLRFFSMDSDISEGRESSEIKSLSDFAVLVRIGRQMEVLEKAFGDHGIPFRATNHFPLFGKEPARTIVDLLRLSITRNNRVLRERLLKKGGISDKEIDVTLSAVQDKRTAGEKVESLIGLFFSDPAPDEQRSLYTLRDLAGRHPSLESFLELITMGTGIDSYERTGENVSLLTLHASKGLEFTCVFIVGCEEGLIPYSLWDRPEAAGGKEQKPFEPGRGEEQVQSVEGKLLEEMRLLYVGMTRAKSILFLSHASRRRLFGREYRLNRSRFLDTIEDALTAPPGLPPKKGHEGAFPEDLQPELF